MTTQEKIELVGPTDLFYAEQECRMAHRKLGIRKARNAARKTDYRAAARAAHKMERIAKALARLG